MADPVLDPNAADTAAATAIPTEAAKPVDYKALLLQWLKLDPAADDAAIQAAIEKEAAEPEIDVAALQTQASSAADLQRQLDETTQKFNQLYEEQTALQKQKAEADADEILKVYEGFFTDETSKAAIRNILLNDKDAGIAILNGLKKPDVAPAGAESPAAGAGKTPATPPAPKHDPAAQDAALSEEEISKQIQARAAELKKGNSSMSLARAYQIAENEIRNVA